MNKELEGKIVEIIKDCVYEDRYREQYGADEAASRIAALMPEPLAVLADRKGMYIRAIRHYPDAGQWAIYIQELSIWMTSANYGVEYTGETYAAAEQAAREYLEKMEDVK